MKLLLLRIGKISFLPSFCAHCCFPMPCRSTWHGIPFRYPVFRGQRMFCVFKSIIQLKSVVLVSSDYTWTIHRVSLESCQHTVTTVWLFPKTVRVHLSPLLLILSCASLVAEAVKRLSTMQKTWVWSLGREDSLEKEMASHSSTLAWNIPWTEKPGRLQSMGSQKVGCDWATSLYVLFNRIGSHAHCSISC